MISKKIPHRVLLDEEFPAAPSGEQFPDPLGRECAPAP